MPKTEAQTRTVRVKLQIEDGPVLRHFNTDVTLARDGGGWNAKAVVDRPYAAYEGWGETWLAAITDLLCGWSALHPHGLLEAGPGDNSG